LRIGQIELWHCDSITGNQLPPSDNIFEAEGARITNADNSALFDFKKMAMPRMNYRTAKLALLDLRLFFSQAPKRPDGALLSPDYIFAHGNCSPAPFPGIQAGGMLGIDG
jgi:hypothetical protein